MVLRQLSKAVVGAASTSHHYRSSKQQFQGCPDLRMLLTQLPRPLCKHVGAAKNSHCYQMQQATCRWWIYLGSKIVQTSRSSRCPARSSSSKRLLNCIYNSCLTAAGTEQISLPYISRDTYIRRQHTIINIYGVLNSYLYNLKCRD